MERTSEDARTGSRARICIRPYTPEWIQAVQQFNSRIRSAKPPFELPETPSTEWLPKGTHKDLYQEIFLAVEDKSVRGAYTFKHQQFSIGGCLLEVGMCRMPISEGIVDRRHAMAGIKLVHDALQRQPLLYALGIGSHEAVVTRLLVSMGWRIQRTVPFFFKVHSGFRFLRNIRYMRRTRWRERLLDAAAYSGFGTAVSAAGALLTRNGTGTVRVEKTREFGLWADAIWDECRDLYSMVAVRDASSLNALYPAEDCRFLRLKIIDRHNTIGWAVLLDTAMKEDKYFGNMRVGSIIDCLAPPEKSGAVIGAASRFLEQRGADLMLSNQNHPAWGGGLRRAGFIQGPSNFYFVTSPQLTRTLDGIDPGGRLAHLNRGDGDGPIHL